MFATYPTAARGLYFCHAVEWENAGRLPPEDRTPRVPTSLGFDPLRADWLAVFQKKRTAPWMGKVENVRIVTAVDRARELKRDVSAMKAAYYYRIQFGHCHEEPRRDVSRLVGPRPSKAVACTLAELAKCKPVSEVAESSASAWGDGRVFPSGIPSL